jgi:hypothetical protein
VLGLHHLSANRRRNLRFLTNAEETNSEILLHLSKFSLKSGKGKLETGRRKVYKTRRREEKERRKKKEERKKIKNLN